MKGLIFFGDLHIIYKKSKGKWAQIGSSILSSMEL